MRTRPRAPSWVRVAFFVAVGSSCLAHDDPQVVVVLLPLNSSVHCVVDSARSLPRLLCAERSSLPPTRVPVGGDFQQQDDDAEFERQLEELMRQVDSACLAAAEGAVDDNAAAFPQPMERDDERPARALATQ